MICVGGYMRILHTGDWHIGKIINEFSLLEDQRYIFQQLYQIIEEEKPDCIVIAGDIYDRSIPPKEAVLLLDEVLTTLCTKYKLPTLIISGNHDSEERLSFGSKILEASNLYIVGEITQDIKKISLHDEYGVVNFYLLPYAHPIIVSNVFNEKIRDHDEAFGLIMSKLKENFDSEARNVLVTHNYIVTNPDDMLKSDSERSISIGGTEYIDVNKVLDFDYVALGHLHKPQKVKEDYIRYSGSILKYSFSECDIDKGVVIVDIKEKGNIKIKMRTLTPLREMLILKGKLQELISPSTYEHINRDSYIRADLTDTIDLYDPLLTLRAIYPNIMQIQRVINLNQTTSRTKASEGFQNKSKLDLFKEFYQEMTALSLDEDKEKAFIDILNEGEMDV